LGQSLFITSNIDPDHHLAMQSDFKHMLKEIQGRFQDSTNGVTPCEAVQALDETLASLHQIKKSLKETKEYCAAEEARKQSDKSDSVQRLKASLEKAQAAVEALLGYKLTSEHHYSSGNYGVSLYNLLPEGYVHQQMFDHQVKHLKSQLANQEARLDKIRSELGLSELTLAQSFLHGELKKASDGKQQGQLRNATANVHFARSRLLSYMATHKPMRDVHFGKNLACHLDAMLDAYLEIQKLEQSEP
jgi:ABC-type dipeptide/oligopeptide/nickel transport system ATPase subunit